MLNERRGIHNRQTNGAKGINHAGSGQQVWSMVAGLEQPFPSLVYNPEIVLCCFVPAFSFHLFHTVSRKIRCTCFRDGVFVLNCNEISAWLRKERIQSRRLTMPPHTMLPSQSDVTLFYQLTLLKSRPLSYPARICVTSGQGIKTTTTTQWLQLGRMLNHSEGEHSEAPGSCPLFAALNNFFKKEKKPAQSLQSF